MSKLITPSNPQREPKINGTEIKKSTKLFKSRDDAEAYAKEKRSYLMRINKVITVNNVTIEKFFGFGVPR